MKHLHLFDEEIDFETAKETPICYQYNPFSLYFFLNMFFQEMR